MSGIDLEDRLVESATEVTTTKNEYGDIDYGSSTARRCLYRDISSLSHGQNRNQVMIDGLLWFSPLDGDVAKDAIYYHTSEGYLRIIRVIRAKRLIADDSLQFIKCEVAKQRQIS